MNQPDTNETAGDAAALWEAGADVEALLRFMREKGLNQPRSMDILESVTGTDRGEAWIAVLESNTWRDQYERTLALQEQLAEALLLLSREENPEIKVVLSDSEESLPDAEAILHRRITDR